ncbi:uncharacterized protein LOC123529225 [Mercenaria mercenaria]|uniref:uncharacterized protein LOC123529225 n=1 Tax=Mercenaria mercenaria TaxID=6596 RepID=UPI00234E88C8|nr:uncharacterized protein LOC123529225 [Mercenaria mercenaria]
METEQRQTDSVVRLYVRGSFICSAKVVSSVSLKSFFQKNIGINLKWRLDVKEAEKRYFGNLLALSTVLETQCHGWFYNVCELRALSCPARFSIFIKRIDGKVALVKAGREQLLLMTNNNLTDRLGLKPVSSSSDGPSLYCIHMSRESSQSKDEQADFNNQDEKRCSQYDPYVRGFQTWPPDSSILRKEAVSKAFQEQYDMYHNLGIYTSCARIDHKYIERKLVKEDNLEMEENHGKELDVERDHVKGDNLEKERHHWKSGKTERSDAGEEILPDRKRHKSENHKQRLASEDKHGSEMRKRHRTTSDASSFASVEMDTRSGACSIRNENTHTSVKTSSGKHENRSERKEKHSEKDLKEKTDRKEHSKESQKEKKISSKVSEGIIDLTKDENENPNSVSTNKMSDMSGQYDIVTQKVKENEKTQKKSGKESLLSKLESSLKSVKKKEKDRTEKKKSKHSDKHRSSSKSSKSDKPSSGLGKQLNVEKVFSSMFSGLTKELGRIPKKNKATAENPAGSVEDQANVTKATKKSDNSKHDIEKVEKSSKSKSHKSDRKDKELKYKDSKHKHGKDRDKTKKSKHHKESKSKRKSDDLEQADASEREDDFEVFDSVGSSFDVQEMVRDTLSGREKLATMPSQETVVQLKLDEEKGVMIPGFGDLDEVEAFQSRSKAEVKHIKRSVLVTDSDLKISLPADMEKKRLVGVKLDLQILVNLALFGDEVSSSMSAVCLHLYECVLSLHDFSPSSWTKSVTKEKVEGKNKHMYTVRMFNKKEKTNRSGFDDVTNKLMSIVQKEKSQDWTFPDKEKHPGKCKADKVLVIPMPTMANLSSDEDGDEDEISDVNRDYDKEKDKRIVICGKSDPAIELDKLKNANGKEDMGQVQDVRSETDNDKSGATTTMAAPTTRPTTPNINQVRKRRSSSTEKECSKEKSVISKKSESQDRKRSRSKERNSGDNSKGRRRSRSRHRSSRSNSRDRNRGSPSRDSKRSQSRERSRGSQSRDLRTETPIECDKGDIGKRLEKIASTAVSSDPDKRTNRTDKRRERQYHPYKKDSRPSKRHIPHWSFDLAYSDMNELLQNLTENTFKKNNSKPANVGSYNKVGRRSYGNRGRFSSFRFRRSAIQRTPPREIYSSSEDEEYVVHPDEIPDLKERAKQADVLENFMGTGQDEKEFSKEMLIYEKETKEEKKFVCKKGNSSSSDLIIPGGPKTSTFSGQKLEDSNDASGELAFLGSGRHVENLDRQTSQTSVIERKDTYTNNLIRSKSKEMKSASKEMKPSDKESNKKEVSKTNKNKLDDKKCDSKKTHISVRDNKKTNSKSRKTVYEKEKIYVSLELPCDSQVTVPSEDKLDSKDRQEEHRDLAKENAQKKILSSESDVCLDWTDEEVALDKKETDVFDDSSDGMSDFGHSKSYIVLDMVEESDTELPTKHQADKITQRKEKSIQGREKVSLDNFESTQKTKENDSAGFLSDVEKSVQKSVESMVGSVCLNLSDSAYTVVDECTITPENSFSDTSELETTLAEFFETPESDTTALKNVGEISKIKECSVVLTRVKFTESMNSTEYHYEADLSDEEERTGEEEKLIGEKEDQYKEEERTVVEKESNEKMIEEIPAVPEESENVDVKIKCDKLQKCATNEAEKETKSKAVRERKELVEPMMDDSLQKLPEAKQEEILEGNSTVNIFIQEIIDNCITRIDFVSDRSTVMDGKDYSDISDQSQIIDEAGDRMVSKGTDIKMSEGRQKSIAKAEGNCLCSTESEASCISPLISISFDNSKELSPTVYSDDSQTSTEIDPAYFGKDRLVFVDDIVITAVSELEITMIEKEMNALEHKKKDSFVRQYEMYRNSSVDGNYSECEDVPDLEEFVKTYSNENNRFYAGVIAECLGEIGTNITYCRESNMTVDDVNITECSSCLEECFQDRSVEGSKEGIVQPEKNIFDIMENDLRTESKEKFEVKNIYEEVSTKGTSNNRPAIDRNLPALENDTENILIEIHTVSNSDTDFESLEDSDSFKSDKIKEEHGALTPCPVNTTVSKVIRREQQVEVDGGCSRTERNVLKIENDSELLQNGSSGETMNIHVYEVESPCVKQEQELDSNNNGYVHDTENVRSEPNIFSKEISEGYPEIIDYQRTDLPMNDLLKQDDCTASIISTDPPLDTEIIKNMQKYDSENTGTTSEESEEIIGTVDTHHSLVNSMISNANATCTHSSSHNEYSSESSSTIIYDLKDSQQAVQSCMVDSCFAGLHEGDENTASTWAYPLSEPENEFSQRSSVYLSQIDDEAVFHIRDTIDEETDERTGDIVEVDDADNDNNCDEGLLNVEVVQGPNASESEIVEVEKTDVQQLEHELPQNRDENVYQPSEPYNSSIITPLPHFPRPWFPISQHPYDMWPAYPMWQPFPRPRSPITQPFRGTPVTFMAVVTSHSSPLSPFLWNRVPVYTSNPGYSGSMGHSSNFMTYNLNGSQPPVWPDFSPPSAVGMAPWIISPDNMTPYIQDQNSDTFFITEHVVEKSVDDKESRKKGKVCFEASSVVDIPVHEIPLPKSSPPERRNNPRKLQNMCRDSLGDTCRQNLNSEKYNHILENSAVNVLTQSKVVEHSESEDVNVAGSNKTVQNLSVSPQADEQVSETKLDKDILFNDIKHDTVGNGNIPEFTMNANVLYSDGHLLSTLKNSGTGENLSGAQVDEQMHEQISGFEPDEEISCNGNNKDVETENIPDLSKSANVLSGVGHLLSTLRNTKRNETFSRTEKISSPNDNAETTTMSSPNENAETKTMSSPSENAETKTISSPNENAGTETVSCPNENAETKTSSELSKRILPKVRQNEVRSKESIENKFVEKRKVKSKLKTPNTLSGVGTILEVLKNSGRSVLKTEKHNSSSVLIPDKLETEVGNDMIESELAIFYKEICEDQEWASSNENESDLGKTTTYVAKKTAYCDKLTQEHETKLGLEIGLTHSHVDIDKNKACVTTDEVESDSTDSGEIRMSSAQMFVDVYEKTEDDQSKVDLHSSEKQNEITKVSSSACSEETMVPKPKSMLKSEQLEMRKDTFKNTAVFENTDVCGTKDLISNSVSPKVSIPSSVRKQEVDSKYSTEVDVTVDCSIVLKKDQMDIEFRTTDSQNTGNSCAVTSRDLVQGIEEHENSSNECDKVMPADNVSDSVLATSDVCKVSKDNLQSIHLSEQRLIEDDVNITEGENDHADQRSFDDTTGTTENGFKLFHKDSILKTKADDGEEMLSSVDCPVSGIPLPGMSLCETNSKEPTINISVDCVTMNDGTNISVCTHFETNSDSDLKSVNLEIENLENCRNVTGSLVQDPLSDYQSSYKINDNSETVLEQNNSTVNDSEKEVVAAQELKSTSLEELKSYNFDVSGDHNHSGIVHQRAASSTEINSTGKDTEQKHVSEHEIMLHVENIMKCKWNETKDKLYSGKEETEVENELDFYLNKLKIPLCNEAGRTNTTSEQRSTTQHAERMQRMEEWKQKLIETNDFEEAEHFIEGKDEHMTHYKCTKQSCNSQSAEVSQRVENIMKCKWTETEENMDIEIEQGGERTENELLQKTEDKELYLKTRGIVKTSDASMEKPVEIDILLTDKKEKHVVPNKYLHYNRVQKSSNPEDTSQYLRRHGVVSHGIKPSAKLVTQSLFGMKSRDRHAAKNSKGKIYQKRNQLRLKAMFQANQMKYSKQPDERDKDNKLAYTKEWINQTVLQTPVGQSYGEKKKLNSELSEMVKLPGDRWLGSVSSSTTTNSKSSRSTCSNSSSSRSASRSSFVESDNNKHTYKFKSRIYRKHQEYSDSSESTTAEQYLPSNSNAEMAGSQHCLNSKSDTVRIAGSQRFCRRYRSMSCSSVSVLSSVEQKECSDAENRRKKFKPRRKRSSSSSRYSASSSSRDRHRGYKCGKYRSSRTVRRRKSKSERQRSYSSASSDGYKRRCLSKSPPSRGKYSSGKTRSRRIESFSTSRERSLSSPSRERYRKVKRFSRNRFTSSSSREIRRKGNRTSSRKRSPSLMSLERFRLDDHYSIKRESRWSKYHRNVNRFRNVFPCSRSYYSETSSDSRRVSDSSSCSRHEYDRSDHQNTLNRGTVCVDRVNSNNDPDKREAMKRKLMIVQEIERLRNKKREPEPVLENRTSEINASPSKGQMSPKYGKLTKAMTAITQYTEEESHHTIDNTDERKIFDKGKLNAGARDSQNIKTVLLKPAVLKKLTPAGLGKFLQILDQYSTDRCEWCLALFAADVMEFEDSKQEALRKLANKYATLTILSDINSVDSYLVMELRNPCVLEIFVIVEPPDEDENIRSLIRYCCMEKFLNEHITSM